MPSLSPEELHDRHLENAKRLLNLQDFETARTELAKALTLNPLSVEAFNLAGVLFEMLEDYVRARKYYAPRSEGSIAATNPRSRICSASLRCSISAPARSPSPPERTNEERHQYRVAHSIGPHGPRWHLRQRSLAFGPAAQQVILTFLNPLAILLAVAAQGLIIGLSVSFFIKHANKKPITMLDVLYLLASIGFFALMLLFIWACEKV